MTYENDSKGVSLNYKTVCKAVSKVTKSRKCNIDLDEDWAEDISEYHEKQQKSR